MTDFRKITEEPSLYDHLETKSTSELIEEINTEDQKVAFAVKKVLPQINRLITAAVQQLKKGGRLFYIGAGTSGRLGILDASECPPTFGVDKDLVIGLIAGGHRAILTAVENAEDDMTKGWEDLKKEYNINEKDFVVGLAASGTTPYVIGALETSQKNNIPTGCITCNPGSPLAKVSDFPIEVIVGPEFVTGSSRMKAGTAQKMVLNMISTVSMIQLGRVKGNKMIDMQLSNTKLVERGTKLIQEATGLPQKKAEEQLLKYGSVRKALDNYESR